MKFAINIQSIVEADSLSALLAEGIDLPEETIAITFQPVTVGAAPVSVPVESVQKPARKKPNARKSAAKPGKNAVTKEAEEPEIEEPSGSKFKEVTAADVQGVLRDILKVDSLGGDAAKSLLNKFKAANVSQVAEGDYVALIAAGREIIEEAELTS